MIDLSDHAREISIDIVSAELPADVHGMTAAAVRPGLHNWTITAVFLQDFASNSVDQVLYNAGGTAGHTPFNVEVGVDRTNTVSITNPRYSGLVMLASYKPFGGTHGSNVEAAVTFRCAGNLNKRTS